MKRSLRALVAGGVVAVLVMVRPAAAQTECADLTTQLMAQYFEAYPCPESAAAFPAYEVKFLARFNLLKAAMKTMNRSMRGTFNSRTVSEQLTTYLAQCKAGLEQPVSRDPLSEPTGGLSSVCAVTSPIQPLEMLIKSEASAHINDGDLRTTGYTVVCGTVCPKNLRKADFFYANGEYAGSVGYYGTFSGNGQPRLYGAAGDAEQHFALEIAAKAATIGNGMLYLQVSAATTGETTACKEFAPAGRNGSI